MSTAKGSLRARLVGDSRWAGAGLVAGIVGSIGFNASIARSAQQEAVGNYFLAFSIVVFAATVGRAGLNVTALRLIAEAEGRGDFATARAVDQRCLRLSMLVSVSTGAALALGLHAFGVVLFGSAELRSAGFLVGAWTVFEAIRVVLGDVFRGYDDIKWGVACNQVLRPVFALAAVFAARALDQRLSTIGLLAIAAAASAAAAFGGRVALALKWHRRHRVLGDADTAQLLRIGAPLMVTQITLSVVAQGDIWVVGAFHTSRDVASYGAAVQTARFIVVPLLLINIVLSPQIAKLYSRGEHNRLEQMTRTAATLVGLPVFLGVVLLSLVANPLFGIVYGPAYREAGLIFVILAGGQVMSVLMGSNGLALSMTGNESLLMTATAIAAVLTLIVMALAASLWGMTAVAIASSAGTAANNIALTILTRYRLGIWTHAALTPGAWKQLRLGRALPVGSQK